MKTKEQRIAELQKQIEEIKKEKPLKYTLIKVRPDCGGGIRDDEDVLAISEEMQPLIDYCVEKFEYTPNFKRGKDGKKPCETWYKLGYTDIEIL